MQNTTKNFNDISREYKQYIEVSVDEFNNMGDFEKETILEVAKKAYEADLKDDTYMDPLEGFEGGGYESDEEWLKQFMEQNDYEEYLGGYVHNFQDLYDHFKKCPKDILWCRMPSGKHSVITRDNVDDLLLHVGDYKDREGYDESKFEVISFLRHDAELNKRVKLVKNHERQPEMHGVNDVTYDIKEKYVTNDYYCPTNYNCLGKCIRKKLEIVDMFDLWDKLKDIDFDDYSTIPQANVAIKNKGVNLVVIDYNNKTTKFYAKFDIKVYIYKHKVESGFWHSVLILDRNKYKRIKPDPEVVVKRVQLEDLGEEALAVLKSGEKLKEFKYTKDSVKDVNKTRPTRFYAFDFETYKNIRKKTRMRERQGLNVKTKWLYKQQPWLLQWGNKYEVDFSYDISNPYNLIPKFMKFLKERLIEIDKSFPDDPKQVRKICMVSFNGARFDNHLFMEYFKSKEILCKRRGKIVKCKEWEYKKIIGDESTIKKFSIKCNSLPFENEVYFLDAALFITGLTLKRACKTYGCKNLKDDDDFDIRDYMEVDKITKNEERVIKYGLQDVRALYELMELFIERMKESSKTDINPLDCVSIASYADRVRDYYHSKGVELYYNSRSEIARFERECVYGGRVIVGYLKWNKGCVPADVNSEYPASMFYYNYPCGKREYYNRKLHPEKMVEYKDKLNNQEDLPLCNMKVRFKINDKCIIPLLPVKDCEDKKALVQVGCYTVIELQQAIKYGKFEILEVLFAQEFESSASMFKEFVQTFYDRRLEYKAEMKKAKKEFGEDSTEYKRYNVLQDQCKLIMNSSFGILTLKAFDWEYKFISEKTYERDKDETVHLVAISNGEYLVKYKNSCKHNNYKPIYLGAYILSYSKVILNELIDIVGGFFEHTIIYCDTDSIYITEDKFKLLVEKGKIGNELGQCKNDYGDGSKITNFWCIGKKCKICRIKQVYNNGKEKILIKTTIKGYQGLRKLEYYANLNEEDLVNKIINEKDDKIKKKLERDFDETKNNVKESKKEIYKINEWFNDVLLLGEHGTAKEVGLNKEYESMKRVGFQINVVGANRLFAVTAYDQYQVDKNYKCYPLYYKFDEDHFKYML